MHTIYTIVCFDFKIACERQHIIDILVYSGCYNNIIERMVYKTQKFISHKSGVWEGKVGGVGRFDIWWKLERACFLVQEGSPSCMPLQDERDERGLWVLCCVCVPSSSAVSDSFLTSWTVAHQAPLSMEFSRQEYWSGLPFPTPGDLPNPGIVKPASPMSPASAGRYFNHLSHLGSPWGLL